MIHDTLYILHSQAVPGGRWCGCSPFEDIVRYIPGDGGTDTGDTPSSQDTQPQAGGLSARLEQCEM